MMVAAMAKIGLALHPHRTDALEVADSIVEWAHTRSFSVISDGPSVAAGVEQGDLSACDLVVSVGGDGTMLRAVRSLSGVAVPIIGINLGSLGYLADVEPDSALVALEAWDKGAHEGRWTTEDRMLLDVDIIDNAGVRTSTLALNEVVLEKRDAGHTVHLSVGIDGAQFTTYAADGLIVATPTGSTAYSMSARGPIVSPRLRALLVTPVSPHMLFDRSLVLDPSEPVTVAVLDFRAVSVSVDGRALHTLEPGGVVNVRASDKVARFVRFSSRRFHEVLKSKFGLADR